MKPEPSEEVRAYLSELGKSGGAARAESLTAERRSKIARKAGKASGKARNGKNKGKR